MSPLRITEAELIAGDIVNDAGLVRLNLSMAVIKTAAKAWDIADGSDKICALEPPSPSSPNTMVVKIDSQRPRDFGGVFLR